MNEKKLLFFITERDGRVRQTVNGVVTSLNKKTPLSYNPEGHNEVSIIWERNNDKHGIRPNFSLPFGFVLDGRKILQNDFYKFNIDRELYLVIKKFVCEYADGKYKEYYKQFYKGELDFSALIDKRQERKIEVPVMQGGNAKLLKSFEGTQSEYEFSEGHVNILFTGIDLYKTANYMVLNGIEVSWINYGSDWQLPFSLITTDGEAYGMTFVSQQLEEIFSGTTPFEEWIKTSNWFQKNGETSLSSITTNIKGKIKFKCTKLVGTAGIKIFVYRSNQTIVNQNDYLLLNQTLTLGLEYEFDIDIDIPVAPGESCILVGSYSLVGTDVAVEFSELPETDRLKISFKNKYRNTVVKAYRPYELYKKICMRAGIEESDVVSDILKSCSYCITCGDALRNIANPKIKTTSNDFLKAFDTYLMLGTSVEQRKVIVEERKRFYDYSNPIQLGEVTLTDVFERTDLMFTSIKVGHAEQDIDSLNGKYDFNGYQIYSTGIKRIGSKELDLQSPYSASPYEMEKVRTNFDGKLTTDANTDNKVYVADVNLSSFQDQLVAEVSFLNTGTAYVIVTPNGIDWNEGQKIRITGSALNDNEYIVAGVASIFIANFVFVTTPVQNESNSSVLIEWLYGQVYDLNRSVIPDSGVPGVDTIFNVRLHPYFLLQKHLSWIHGVLDKYDSDKLRFESNNRNKDLVVDGISLSRDITVAEMPAKLMLPVQFDLTCLTPLDLPELMDENPNRCFSFIDNGITYYGFIVSIGMAATTKPQEFSLLSAPINDLTKLIEK